MRYWLMFILTAILFCISRSQTAGVTEQRVVTAFDKAMRTSDGKLMLSILRAGERRGVTAEACTAFLKQFVKPWYEGPSMERLASGRFARLNGSDCHLVLEFGPKGGARYAMVELPRKVVFKTPVIKEGEEFRSSVGFAQILFAIGDTRANGPGRDMLAEMKLSQQLVESWIPKVRKLGIKGSFDPETNKYNSWDEIIRISRADVKRWESRQRGKSGR